MGKKKPNPRKIPLTGEKLSYDAAIHKQMQHITYRAWLLIFTAMLEREMRLDLAVRLWNATHENTEIADGDEFCKNAIENAEQYVGFPLPTGIDRAHYDRIKSQVELNTFYKKASKIAHYGTFAIIAASQEKAGLFTRGTFSKVLFDADLIDAELVGGIRTESEMERAILEYGISMRKKGYDDLFCDCVKPCGVEMKNKDGFIHRSIPAEALRPRKAISLPPELEKLLASSPGA